MPSPIRSSQLGLFLSLTNIDSSSFLLKLFLLTCLRATEDFVCVCHQRSVICIMKINKKLRNHIDLFNKRKLEPDARMDLQYCAN